MKQQANLEYNEWGQGEPILFIHGAFSNGNTWRKVIPALSKHYRCIVPEWPFGGHRIPVSKQTDLSPTGVAEIIAQFINSLQLPSVTIIANDTGGAYAQVFAALHPTRVDKLILSNCEGFEVFPPQKFKSLGNSVKIPGYTYLMGQLFRIKSFLKKPITFGLLSNSLSGQDLQDLYVKNFIQNSKVRANFKSLAIAWHPKYTLMAAQKLSEFKKPVLVLWGQDDKALFPVALGKRIAAIFPSSEFIEIPRSMTYIQEDQPQQMVLHILKFLEGKAKLQMSDNY
jgi:pimeloyl-ACP methyl ester carboxylesterase